MNGFTPGEYIPKGPFPTLGDGTYGCLGCLSLNPAETDYVNNTNGFKDFVDNCNIDEDIIFLHEFFSIKEKKVKILNKKLNKQSNYVFITLQDFHRRICDLDKLNQFIKNIIYLYSEGYYCIESGHSDPPNLHIHLLVKIINPKKHKQKINLEWIKVFKDTNLYENDYYKLTQWRQSVLMPPYEQWIEEKITYFDNESKGTHGNTIELNSRGQWGVPES